MNQESNRAPAARVRPFQLSFFAGAYSLVNTYITHSQLDSKKTEALHRLKLYPIYKHLPRSPGNHLQTDLFLLRECVEALCLVEQHDEAAALSLLYQGLLRSESKLKRRAAEAEPVTHLPYSPVSLFLRLGTHLARSLGDAAGEERFQLSCNGSQENRPEPRLGEIRQGQVASD